MKNCTLVFAVLLATSASVAALTLYDMCKALSHDIVIRDIRLLRKHGGKSDFERDGDAA